MMRTSLWVLGSLALVAIVLLLCINTPSWVGWLYNAPLPIGLADFQGAFAVPTTIFTGLAFAGLVCTIVVQQGEIREQRAQFKVQVAELGQQSAESMLVSLVDQLNDLRNSVSIRLGDRDLAGRAAISALSRATCAALMLRPSELDLAPAVLADLARTAGGSSTPTRDEIERRWEILYAAALSDPVGHLFRSTYVLARFIDEDEHLDREVAFRILRSQWSQAELALLFYNALVPRGAKLRDLLERHDLLQNLHSRALADPSHRVWIGSRFADDGE